MLDHSIRLFLFTVLLAVSSNAFVAGPYEWPTLDSRVGINAFMGLVDQQFEQAPNGPRIAVRGLAAMQAVITAHTTAAHSIIQPPVAAQSRPVPLWARRQRIRSPALIPDFADSCDADVMLKVDTLAEIGQFLIG